MKNMKKTIAALAVTLCLFALAIGYVVPAGRVSDERFISDVRQSYRSAALVVSAVCTGSYTDSNGLDASSAEVTGVMAGSAVIGDTLKVAGQLTEGQEYLLYLNYDEEVPYAEDEQGYVQVSDNPFIISGESVKYGGSSVSLDALHEEMERLNNIVTMPAATYYYDDLASLMDASELVFIGYVRDAAPLSSTRFRSEAGGSTVERNALSSKLEVVAYGSIKGPTRYGQTLSLLHCPDFSSSMLNGGSLLPNPLGVSSIVPMKEGNTYLFFLDQDPDPKQEHCFPINPVQGWIRIEGDSLDISRENGALRGYTDFAELVSDINKLK